MISIIVAIAMFWADPYIHEPKFRVSERVPMAYNGK